MASHLESLVDDVLIQILAILSVWDVLRLRQVSKRMDSLTCLRTVWHNIFKDELLGLGRPVPGCSIDTLLRRKSGHEKKDTINEVLSSELLLAQDYRTRILHALRLEKRWKATFAECRSSAMKFGCHPVSTSWEFSISKQIHALHLLPGGRHVISICRDCVQCWDLGFPRASTDQSGGFIDRRVSCVAETALPKGILASQSYLDSGNQDGDVTKLVVCEDVMIQDSIRSDVPRNKRVCIMITIQKSSSKLPGGESLCEQDSHLYTLAPELSLERSVSLPFSLPIPYFDNENNESSESHVSQLAEGKLGAFLLSSDNLIFFESFVTVPDSDSSRYVGIEVLNVATYAGEGQLASVLLSHPELNLGDYAGLYVYKDAKLVIVVWENGVSVYRIPNFAESCSPVETIYHRRLIYPVFISFLSQRVAKPVAFTPCKLLLPAEGPNHQYRLLPLTILARSLDHPNHIVHTVLSVFNEDTSSHHNIFQLTHISNPMPRFFGSNNIGANNEVLALELGQSGRGLRVDTSGAIYRCTSSNVRLPFPISPRFRPSAFGVGPEIRGDRDEIPSEGGGGCRFGRPKPVANTAATVDFWPYRRLDNLPDALQHARSSPSCSSSPNGDSGYEGGILADVGRLITRFDEGMGRMVAVRVYDAENSDESGHTSVSVLDFV